MQQIILLLRTYAANQFLKCTSVSHNLIALPRAISIGGMTSYPNLLNLMCSRQLCCCLQPVILEFSNEMSNTTFVNWCNLYSDRRIIGRWSRASTVHSLNAAVARYGRQTRTDSIELQGQLYNWAGLRYHWFHYVTQLAATRRRRPTRYMHALYKFLPPHGLYSTVGVRLARLPTTNYGL